MISSFLCQAAQQNLTGVLFISYQTVARMSPLRLSSLAGLAKSLPAHKSSRMACRQSCFPDYQQTGDAARRRVQFADIGCGFGGLLIRLSTAYPDTLMVGLEIRDKVI